MLHLGLHLFHHKKLITISQFCLAGRTHHSPRSAHFGGLWERAVKAAKPRCVESSLLRFEKLRTLVCQIPAIVSSRPSVSISEKRPGDLDVLHSAHFFLCGLAETLVEPDLTAQNYNRLDVWLKLTHLKQIFGLVGVSLLQQRSQ